MIYLTLAVFIIVTTIHLYASWHKDQKLRNYTKPFILLALLAFYMLGAAEMRISIVLALIFSWIGDVLLIPKGVKWFTAGGIAFMISHAFFILGYSKDISPETLPIWIMVLLEAIFLVIVFFIFKKLKEHLKKSLFYPMFLYLMINGTMNCFAILRMLSHTNRATIITCIGAVLFFVSDTTLFFVRFKKDSALKSHFITMLTYAVGELLIVIGLI
ncbi:MAG: lysoplasmalogenase [Eubacteriales bacterium]|nr:lysoplasmalogenase [Eubacteriales bacterium]